MSKTRVLRITLKEPLLAALKNHHHNNKAALAKAIGVSRPKLNHIIEGKWEYITRDAIERVADYLDLKVGDIFQFIPIDFWSPIEAHKKCTFLRGSHNNEDNGELRIPYFDLEATHTIEKFLHMSVSGAQDLPYSDRWGARTKQEQDRVVQRASEQNCIVIGSPKSNPITEVLLSRFFDAEPFDPSTPNRQKIPFGFCWPEDSDLAKQSSLTCSLVGRKGLEGKTGIALSKGHPVSFNYLARDEYQAWETDRGLDCGLIFVANRPFGTEHDVKLIVLAGLGGVGTLGAAHALVEDFRYLEPLPGERCVFGIVEAFYAKAKNSMERVYGSFKWRHRVGGHDPINHPGKAMSAKSV